MKRIVVLSLIALSTRELFSQKIFENITNVAGIQGIGLTNSVSFNDYNNDGKPDLYIIHQAGSELYKNNGDRTFTSVTDITSLPSGEALQVGIMGDYDNDGDLDIFAAGEIYSTYEETPYFLFRNDGNSKFTDVSNIAGMGSARVFSAAWFDFDNDSHLDLFLGTLGPTPNNLFLKNLGNKTFANLSGLINLTGFGSNARGIATGDFDRDGDIDVFVPNTDRRNYFFRNDGNVFSEIAAFLGIDFPTGNTHSAEFADYDNDGDLDLLIGSNDNAGPFRLLRNEGNIFKDVTVNSGLDPTTIHFRGSSFNDFDNDGYLDLIVIPNNARRKIALFHNNSNGTFSDITSTSGLDTLGSAQK